MVDTDDRNDDNSDDNVGGQGTVDHDDAKSKDNSKDVKPKGDTDDDKDNDQNDDNDNGSVNEDDDDDDDSDEDDVDSDDDRLNAKVRRQLKAKNRENRRLRERATSAEAKALRYEVAEKAGLSLTLAKRLTGSTEDELVADAAALIEDFGIQGRVSPSNLPDNGDDRRGDRRSLPTDLDATASRIYARNN